MPGGASLTYKIYLTDGAHPGLYRPVHLLLMKNVTLWIRECLGTAEKGQYSISRKSPPTL